MLQSKVGDKNFLGNRTKKIKKNVWLTSAECDFNEQCMPLMECGVEYKHALNRDYDKLRKVKICGVELNTVNDF